MCSAVAFAGIKTILLIYIHLTIGPRTAFSYTPHVTDLVHLYASYLQSTLYNDLLFADVLSLAV